MNPWRNSFRLSAQPRRFGPAFTTNLIIIAIWGMLGIPVWGSNTIGLLPDDDAGTPLAYRLVWSTEPGVRYQL